jgi:hypothetical protein
MAKKNLLKKVYRFVSEFLQVGFYKSRDRGFVDTLARCDPENGMNWALMAEKDWN